MKNGECPKCGSHEVFASVEGPGIMSNDWHWHVRTAYGMKLSESDQTLLCASCGYWENYLRHAEALHDIAANAGGENWVKVTPAVWGVDPTGRHELRYWDGTAWTSAVSDHGIAADDPIGP